MYNFLVKNNKKSILTLLNFYFMALFLSENFDKSDRWKMLEG